MTVEITGKGSVKKTVEKNLPGSCDMDDKAMRKACRRKEVSVPSEVDPSVKVAVVTENEITIDLAGEQSVHSSGHVYVQFTSDKLRSPSDAVVLVPAGGHEEAALRKALVPPIDMLNRRADTGGIFAMPINPDLPPDAERNADVPEVPLGFYALLYVRQNVEPPALKYISSEEFEVAASAPTQPGQVKVSLELDGKLSLQWAAPLFNGGSKEEVKYKLEYCDQGSGCKQTTDWKVHSEVLGTKTVIEGNSAPKGVRWRATAFNSLGQSQPGWES